MFHALKKLLKRVFYLAVLLVLVSAYINYRENVNDIIPVEKGVKNIIPAIKDFVSQFAVPKPERYIVKPANTTITPTLTPEPIITEVIEEPQPYYYAHQTRYGKEVTYGFDNNFNLVLFQDSQEKTYFYYTSDNLLSKIIAGERRILFDYNDQRNLIKINDGNTIAQLKYDFYGLPTRFVLPDETLKFNYEGGVRLVDYQRNEGTKTIFSYNNNKISSYTKDLTTTTILYNQDELAKTIQTGQNYLILNYGKDNLLSYLAGPKYGLGETISYNPTDIRLVSANDDSVFTSETEMSRIHSLNLYLGCTKFKRIPVLFDPLAFILFQNYLKYDLTRYFVNNYVCDVVYTRTV